MGGKFKGTFYSDSNYKQDVTLADYHTTLTRSAVCIQGTLWEFSVCTEYLHDKLKLKKKNI